MTTGLIAPAGDLDILFKARTSTKIADVGFLSNGGVDLSNRFEPRGATTAIANTGFKSGANDLAQLFMDIAAAAETITIANKTCSSFTVGVTASATYRLVNTGDIQTTEGTNTLVDTGDWLTPKTNMGNYSAFVTLVSGTISSGITGSWTNLGSSRSWSLNSPTVSGVLTTVFDIAIRLDSSGVTLDTARITLQAERGS